jgi:peptide deformylase
MARKIINVKDPLLREKSKPVKAVDKKVLNLIQDLKETLAVQKDPEGIGLAAPQIGRRQRVFVAKIKDEIRAFINPKVVSAAKLKKENESGQGKKSSQEDGSTKSSKGRSRSAGKIMEGCLSLPNFYGPLRRPQKIKIKYLNEKGKEVVETLEGFGAQIVQHEIDHLNGVLFIDRLLEQKKPLYELVDEEWEEVDLV